MLIFCISLPAITLADINATDDLNNVFKFKTPLKRIISLSPHATELLFAAGASNQIIGAVNYSDYPEAAKKIPRIGGYNKLDLEKIIALRPELIIIWPGGNPADQLEEIKQLGIPTFASEPQLFEDVARNISTLGKILGTEPVSEPAANTFLKRLSLLRDTYKNRSSINVFYQVWNKPLMTINNGHLVSQIISLCGGVNIFGDLPTLAPRISIESVIGKNPDIIVAGMTEDRQDWLTDWSQWKNLKAVKHQQVYPVNAELVIRQTPRALDGAQLMCETFDKAREHYSKTR